MILCGWCGVPTSDTSCVSCHRDPALPWVQRNTEPPSADRGDDIRKRLSGAERQLRADGRPVTVERIAELLDVSDRTVRRWREMAAARPSGVRPDPVRMST